VLSDEQLLILVRRQINFDRNHKAAARHYLATPALQGNTLYVSVLVAGKDITALIFETLMPVKLSLNTS
jgi:hypothetical protein